jgi:lipopolysaccharide transport system ATP-binding protein
MDDIAVRVSDLGKQYLIGRVQDGNRTFREALTDAVAAPFRRAASLMGGQSAADVEQRKEFWALRGASFEVKRGEVIGLIGRNGAGKSTLLKILTKITEPTTGRVEISGRVASLLEVGTGFHSELTGRENIYLNGAILGMTKKEINRQFDDIVAFSETAEFIDTPVKHYSSGMYLRLAFAVAAHLEPDILLVDEVLAVGDSRFQTKCLSKMQDIGKHGRTVLFVSHNMPAVMNLCSRAILLNDGCIQQDGPAYEVVSKYMTAGFGTSAAREWADPFAAPGGNVARLRAVRVQDGGGNIAESVDIRRSVCIGIEYDVLRAGHKLVPFIQVFNAEGICAFETRDVTHVGSRPLRSCGRYLSTVTIPGNYLASGTMFVNVGVHVLDPFHREIEERSVVAFEVVDALGPGTARGEFHARVMAGVVRPLLPWKTEQRVHAVMT